MKYLITGGAGFVGSNLSKALIDRNENLVIVDNLSREGSSNNLIKLQAIGEFKFFQEDVSFQKGITEIIKEEQPDILFHLAGQVAMTHSINNPFDDFRINAQGTLNILEAIRLYSPKTIVVYSSTNKVYGDFGNVDFYEEMTRYSAVHYPNGFDESMPLEFHSPYGCSKGTADQYLLDYHRIYGIKTVVFRHSSMYGGFQNATKDQGWVGWFCKKAYEQSIQEIPKSFTISGDGKQVRDLLHAKDVVNLYLSVYQNINKLAGQAFNIGGGMNNSLSLLELFTLLENEFEIKLKFDKLPFRQSDQLVFVANNELINQRTGWNPKIDYQQGIKSLINDLKNG